jgi:arginyl-tRNA synthetase
MKQQVKELLSAAWRHLAATGQVTGADLPDPQVDRTRDPAHGDFATNLALVMAKVVGGKPRDLAARLVAALPASALIARTEIAGPGFINFFLAPGAHLGLIPTILAAGPDYGRSSWARASGSRSSSSPPIPPALCTSATAGARLMAPWWRTCWRRSALRSIASITSTTPAGRWTSSAASVWLRYLELCGEEVRFPSQRLSSGDYVWDIAATLHRDHWRRLPPRAPPRSSPGRPRMPPAPMSATPRATPCLAPRAVTRRLHIDALVNAGQGIAGRQPLPLCLRAGAEHHPRRYPR